MNGPWFDPVQFGTWYGIIAGGGGGTLCGVLGAAAGVYAPRGRGRGVILGAMILIVVVGVIQLAFGAIALLARQPYGIWYPPLLVGFVMTLVTSILIPVIKRRYASAEQCRIDAQALRDV